MGPLYVHDDGVEGPFIRLEAARGLPVVVVSCWSYPSTLALARTAAPAAGDSAFPGVCLDEEDAKGVPRAVGVVAMLPLPFTPFETVLLLLIARTRATPPAELPTLTIGDARTPLVGVSLLETAVLASTRLLSFMMALSFNVGNQSQKARKTAHTPRRNRECSKCFVGHQLTMQTGAFNVWQLSAMR